ncbi:MAG: T9SS type A sorting domain-containing protein [Bacteroidales bacterium]|nr:T9SS type A sorting domain-containing protein [Bacteroidales bacterium]
MNTDNQKSLKPLAVRLAGYSLTAGALALTTGITSGQVTYSGIRNLGFDEPGILNPIDLNGDGVTDFNVGLAWDSYLLNSYSTYSAFIQNPASNSWVGSSSAPRILSQLYEVSNSLLFSNNVLSYYNLGWATSGDFLGKGNVFIGVRFIIPDPTPTEHLGWIRVNIDAYATEFVVVDWAYQENELTSISCGKLPLDQIPPEPSLSATATSPVFDDFPVEITFSEPVSGFKESDIEVVGGSVVEGSLASQDKIAYTAMIHPVTDTLITVKIPGSVVTDADGNLNMPGANRIYLEYISIPKVTLSALVEEPVSSAFDITIEFSENVSQLGYEDIVLTNANIEAGSLIKVSPSVYQARIVPEGTGYVLIDIPAGVIEDADLNKNFAAETLIIEADYDSPHVVLYTNETEPVDGSFEIFISFGEPVEGFQESDLRITNGFITAGSLATNDNQIYSVMIIPASSGEVIIHIPEDAALDEEGFGNLASEPLTVMATLGTDALETASAGLLKAFPNPTAGTFQLDIPEAILKGELIIFDARGMEVLREKSLQRTMDFNLSGLSTGLYLIRVQASGQIWQQKLILE